MRFLPICVTLSLILPIQGAFAFDMQEFKNPDPWYHTAPLWVWNDDITEEQVLEGLDMLKSQGILQPFVHPRPGLITPYLSERWLDLYETAVRGAKERGMLVHIYDENSYPSGFAGGHVPAKHPEWGGKGLVWEEVEALPSPLPPEVVGVYAADANGYVRLDPKSVQADAKLAVVKIVYTQPKAWNGGFPYVDLLEPGLTEHFLEVTYGPYRERFGDEFGKTIRGAFTDEPHLVPSGNVHWTPRLPQLFQDRYGYSLIDSLPSLFADTGDFQKVRFDFYQLLLDEFIERWGKPYFDFCEKNNLMATGHFWEHEWPRPRYGSDNMAMYSYQQMPAIDCLMNQYDEGTHAQFGNVRAVKELGSIAAQLGLPRTVCEIYGAGGWEMSFEDQKRIADWLGVLGVNLFDQHLCYMTLRGPRKRDHPLSFTDHEPWWEHYHILAKYLARLSYALSQGKENNHILVIEPTTTGWMMFRATGDNAPVDEMGADCQAFMTRLSLDQVEYDLASERVLQDRGSVQGKRLHVGAQDYDLVIVHRTVGNLMGSSAELLNNYYDAGGTILFVGGKPEMVDGRSLDEPLSWVPSEIALDGLVYASPGTEFETKAEHSANGSLAFLQEQYGNVRFIGAPGGKLFHQTRIHEGGKLVFVCNTSNTESVRTEMRCRGKGIQLADLFTGRVSAAPFKTVGAELSLPIDLPPAASALYVITDKAVEPAVQEEKNRTPLPLKLLAVERVDPNVLTVDYCDYEVKGEAGKDRYFYAAQTAVFKAHGFDRNPWDNAVQFEDRILKQEGSFGADSGFSVTYRFTIAGFNSPPALDVVVEQADLFEVSLNGTPLQVTGAKWLDRHFFRISCGKAIKSGENALTLTAKPFSIHHELEPIYVLGDFSLETSDKGWVITPPKALVLGSWKDQGLPFYPGAVRYRYAAGKGAKDCVVQLPNWKGTMATAQAGEGNQVIVAWPPYEAPIGSLADNGDVTLEVIGSLKNLLGPHHGEPKLGTAWPGQFQKGPETGPPPGVDYDTLAYGLMADPLAYKVE